MEKVTREFQGVWISKHIWESTELSMTEKFLMIEISSLDGVNGCFASNSHFAEFLGKSQGTVANIISSLAKRGFIDVTLIYKEGTKVIEKRIIRVKDKFKYLQAGLSPEPKKEVKRMRKSSDPIHKKMNTPYSQKNEEGIHEKVKGNNTILIIQKETTTKTQPESEKEVSGISSSNLEFLNEKEFSRINSKTKANIKNNFPELTKANFIKIFDFIVSREKKGKIGNFDGALYSALKENWNIEKPTVPSEQAMDTEKAEKIMRIRCNQAIADLESGSYKVPAIYETWFNDNLSSKTKIQQPEIFLKYEAIFWKWVKSNE